jgi:hypothetical protein
MKRSDFFRRFTNLFFCYAVVIQEKQLLVICKKKLFP